MIDPFGRSVTYLRLSVTDRCDLRCVYCMSEDMTFLPRADLLSIEELVRLAETFVDLGVRKIRLTGGEPLVRRGVMELIRRLGGLVDTGRLAELTLTTNATQLAGFAADLVAAGIRRINVSVDSLEPDVFRGITRGRGDIGKVLAGLAAAKAAGLKIKINAVALKGVNDGEFDTLIRWCGEQGHDLTLIETMPLGEIDGDRTEQYLPLDAVRRDLERRWTLEPLSLTTGGPASYWRIAETGRLLGCITPLTHNFCEGCNRVRVTCTGTLYMCLGQEDQVDLRSVLRGGGSAAQLRQAILEAIAHKPKGHDFIIDREHKRPALARHMSTTGG